MKRRGQFNQITIDGNEAAARMAYLFSEVMAIYPITPSSPMGELGDLWSSQGKKNILGITPTVVEMQSEAGAAGAIHGSLQGGAMTTTFTASQGLMLMLPNMYKIAAELSPTVFHVAARSLAAQALSIFGDHSDVMAARQTGFCLMASSSVQEVQDLALISHLASLKARLPFLHFFDGFRTSHEVKKISEIPLEAVEQLVKDLYIEQAILDFRSRALTPDDPAIRGTSQNPDVYFQGRERVNPVYTVAPEIVQKVMDSFARLTGRSYKLFQYHGHPQAERVIILMGSGAEAAWETVNYLNHYPGEKVGVLNVHLYRPFSKEHFLKALPSTVRSIAVMDRTKEPGATGCPLYLDVCSTIQEAHQDSKSHFVKRPLIIGGRYGLSSKEFTPAMIVAIFKELQSGRPMNNFMVGVVDDIENKHLKYDPAFSLEKEDEFCGIFWGLGADGTVSGNKSSIKIIGEFTDNYAQGHFTYDSKKSGSITTSYLRFGKEPIHSTYLIQKANFVACHQFEFVKKYNVLEKAAPGATFLLNSPFEGKELWDHLPRPLQQEVIDKKIKFYYIDAQKVALDSKLGRRINTVMQACFFAISDIIPQEVAIAKIKESIQKSFGKKGELLVRSNFLAVDRAVDRLRQLDYPQEVTSQNDFSTMVSPDAPEFIHQFTEKLLCGQGDSVPVSMMPEDGTFATGTSQWEKRNIASHIPEWDPETCIQCGKCAFICPHAAIRTKAYESEALEGAPREFQSISAKGREWPENTLMTIQVSPQDCTGCELCVEICPAKNKEQTSLKALNMVEQRAVLEQEKANWEHFLNLPDYPRDKLKVSTVKGSQFLQPLFEFSGACAGCGETPYIKLATQLFGDRMLVANATGCSSIYGGNLPTTPYTKNDEGKGPAWSNSLFEDNAEFGMGMRVAVDKRKEMAEEMLLQFEKVLGSELIHQTLEQPQIDESEIYEQRERVELIKKKVAAIDHPLKEQFLSLADYLVKKSLWVFGGDGWAYDIGFGGLDHLMASDMDVNILVLDTEVYSNTGGQMSKSTPKGAVAKFAASGKSLNKKDLGSHAMSYGHVYVGQVAMGANDTHTLKTFLEAEKYQGPSLIIAYSHCIAHGYNLKFGPDQQKKAVASGHWNLYRYHPERDEHPLILDSKRPKLPLAEYRAGETRYRILQKLDPKRAKDLELEAQDHVKQKWEELNYLAQDESKSHKTEMPKDRS